MTLAANDLTLLRKLYLEQKWPQLAQVTGDVNTRSVLEVYNSVGYRKMRLHFLPQSRGSALRLVRLFLKSTERC